MSDTIPPDARPSPPPPPARAPARTQPPRVRAYTPGGTARMIERAPWYATVTAAVVDLTVIAVLGACLYQRRLQSTAGEVIALLILAGVAGVRIADIARSIRGGGPPTGAGPTLALVALLAQAGHWVSGWVRVVALGTRPTSLPPPVGMVLLFVAVMLGCASRQPGDPGMATAKIVLATASEVRNGLCDRSLFGAPPPIDVDNAPRDLAAVVGQVRAWLCADALGSLLDLARELATPRPSPAAESDAGPTAATDASTDDASSGAPDDTGPPPTVETSDVDAGEVSP